MTKYVLIQSDGMGDMLHGNPLGQSALTLAKTPNMDKLASAGKFGLVQTIPEGFPPGSDVGNLGLFGYAPQEYHTGRSPIEAAALGIKMGADDIAFRMNLVTINDGMMTDFAGGHLDDTSAHALVNSLRDACKHPQLEFYGGVSYRHVMVWRNGMVEMITTPPHDISDQAIEAHLPQGEGAQVLLEVMELSRKVFAEHQVLAERHQKGLNSTNQVWLWGQGHAMSLPPFQTLRGKSLAVITAVDLVRGIAVSCGADLIDVPGATGYIDTDFVAKGRYGVKALEDHDMLYLHVEAPDEAGHQKNQELKIDAIQSVDEHVLGPLIEYGEQHGDLKILITSDHATPVSTGTHSYDPVPFAYARVKELGQPGEARHYCEADALQANLHIKSGVELLEAFLS